MINRYLPHLSDLLQLPKVENELVNVERKNLVSIEERSVTLLTFIL